MYFVSSITFFATRPSSEWASEYIQSRIVNHHPVFSVEESRGQALGQIDACQNERIHVAVYVI